MQLKMRPSTRAIRRSSPMLKPAWGSVAIAAEEVSKVKITKQRLKEIIREELEYTADIDQYAEPDEEEDPMASLLGTPEEQLLSRILLRAVVDNYGSTEDLAADLGVEMTNDMVRFIGSLKANPMYGSSE